MQQMGEGERGRREGGDSDNGAGIASKAKCQEVSSHYCIPSQSEVQQFCHICNNYLSAALCATTRKTASLVQEMPTVITEQATPFGKYSMGNLHFSATCDTV